MKHLKTISYKYKFILVKFLFFIIIFLAFYEGKDINNARINIGYFCSSFKNGGVERVMSLLIKYLSKEKRFNHLLITVKNKSQGEYFIYPNIRRISLFEKKISLIEVIKTNHIDLLIYNYYSKSEIRELNKLTTTKIS